MHLKYGTYVKNQPQHESIRFSLKTQFDLNFKYFLLDKYYKANLLNTSIKGDILPVVNK